MVSDRDKMLVTLAKVIDGEALALPDIERYLNFLKFGLKFDPINQETLAAVQVRLRSQIAEQYNMTPRG